jgi:hypothetical protein
VLANLIQRAGFRGQCYQFRFGLRTALAEIRGRRAGVAEFGLAFRRASDTINVGAMRPAP